MPSFRFIVGESGKFSFRVAALRSDTNQGYGKTSLRISVEALRSHCGNTKRGKRIALPLQGIVHSEISQVSTDDCFAALQIAVGGFLPALSLQLLML